MKHALVTFLVMVLISLTTSQAEETAETKDHSTQEVRVGKSHIRPENLTVVTDLKRLLRLQDESATGEASALSAQKQLISELDHKLKSFFESAPAGQLVLIAPDVIAFVLSGGDPTLAMALARKDAVDITMRRLLEASAVFMQGDGVAAARLLRELDMRRLPLRLAGRLALVGALLETEDDAAKQAYLAEAIAAMPGTLIEESALRRSALAYADSADERHFWERLARYQRRFPDSLYSAAFWRDVSDVVINWSANDANFRLERLDLTWESISLAQRRGLYLRLTRQAAAANNRYVMEFAAARLGRLAVKEGQEDQISRLYMAIYRIASPEGDIALRKLKSIRRDLLAEQDRELLNAALAISEQINRPLPAVASSMGHEEIPLHIRGQQALTDSARLLESPSF